MTDLAEWTKSMPKELLDLPHLKGSESLDQFKQSIVNDAAWRGPIDAHVTPLAYQEERVVFSP